MTFSAQWLALREPHDRRARNATVLAAVTAFADGRPSLSVSDLGSGTGSTLRALATHLPQRQTWRLADNDLSLLARIESPSKDIRIAPLPVDLARDLELALDGAIDLVTASALLDLVSEEWIERLVTECAARRLPLYAALNYDGRIAFDQPDRDDAAIVAAVNKHQRTDKGFGAALGPEAARIAIGRFTALGYRASEGKSDWAFGPKDREIQTEIVAGWASAAIETGDVTRAVAADWVARRGTLIAEGRSAMQVGHIDFFAAPKTTR